MASAPKRGLFFNKVPVVKATADNIRAFGEESTDLTTLSATSQGVDLDIESKVGDRQAKALPSTQAQKAKVPSTQAPKAKAPSTQAPKAKPAAPMPEVPEAE